MIEQTGRGVAFYAFYTSGGVGKPGLAVTVDVYRATSGVVLAADAAATAIGGGVYRAALDAAQTTTAGEYVAVFKTNDATVDQRHLPAIWTVGAAWVEAVGAALPSLNAPLSPDGDEIVIVRGDDYTPDSGRALPEWTNPSWAAHDLLTAAIALRIGGAFDDGAPIDLPAQALSATRVRVSLPRATTDRMAPGRAAHRFDLQATLATGAVVTLVQGWITVLRDVR